MNMAWWWWCTLCFLRMSKPQSTGGLDACFVRETIESACLCAPYIESFINVGEGSKVSYLYVSVLGWNETTSVGQEWVRWQDDSTMTDSPTSACVYFHWLNIFRAGQIFSTNKMQDIPANIVRYCSYAGNVGSSTLANRCGLSWDLNHIGIFFPKHVYLEYPGCVVPVCSYENK